MKFQTKYLLVGVVPLLASCASQPIALGPVGPNPLAGDTVSGGTGCLRVFSEQEAVTEGAYEGANPTYFQYTDYRIYDEKGNLLKRVDNSVGHYETTPRLVTLPPGRYIVKARAKDYLSVTVPVIIKSDLTTNLHLDDQWQPVAASHNQLVIEPSGKPVGWKAAPSNQPAKAPQDNGRIAS